MTELSQGLLKTEAECAEGRTAPRVSLADIERNIIEEHIFNAGQTVELLGHPSSKALHLLTICLIVTRNGFTVVGKSAPASADNFDRDLGAKLAKEDAVRQLWPLMGYALRERLSQPDPFAGDDLEHYSV